MVKTPDYKEAVREYLSTVECASVPQIRKTLRFVLPSVVSAALAELVVSGEVQVQVRVKRGRPITYFSIM